MEVSQPCATSYSSPSWTKSLQYLINHVFLPPKLPQSDDAHIESEHALVQSLLDSLQDFGVLVPESRPGIRRATRMLEDLVRLQPGVDDVDKLKTYQKLIAGLKDGGKLDHSTTDHLDLITD